jgi:glycosyltransferase involved in cell wall biosynthesis
MKRIVRLVNLYPPYIVGGNELLTYDIEKALRRRGYEVHALTARGRALEGQPFVHPVFNYSLDEKEAIFLGGRRLTPAELFRYHVFDPVTYRNVQREVQRLQPDLILVDNLYMASAAPLLAVRDMPCPVIAQVADRWLLFILRDWGMVVQPRTPVQRLFVCAVRRFIQQPLARRARIDGIVAVSQFIRDLYVRAGFPPHIIETHYLGIDLEVFRPGPEHPLHDPVRLLFVGSLWEGKGPQVAIRALRYLGQMESLPRFHLHIYGDGSEGFKDYLRNLILEEGVEDRVTFHGFVPWSELVRAMHEADIFLFPSVWDEPFAITPIQAMGCGLPVVATWTGGTPEGFVDGETALLIPPNDPRALANAIVCLVQNPELRQRLREKGIREAQERWGFEAYVDRLIDFYHRVFERWQQRRRDADRFSRA